MILSSSDFSDQNSDMTWSLIFWDYLITLDDEITLFWFSRRSWIKFLFFANRYMGLILRMWDVVWEHLEDADHPFSYFLCGQDISMIDAIQACLVATESGSVLYVTMQLLVIESILVLRIWAIMGRQRWILWTFFGLLVCSTTTSIVLNVYLFTVSATLLYTIPTLVFEAIIFISAAYHGIKISGGLRSLLLRSKGPFRYGPKPILRLVIQGSVLYFIAVLCSLPVMAFLDPRLGITIMSVTISHMLLRLRKQGLSDTVGPPSQGVELTTLRATVNRAMSLEAGKDVMNIGPFPQGR
ncbi:hypothetical protein EV421DRAFT_1910771 [Armillaria borealis]|uniref:DUF6533 domain-containing protein n=1 Tax=Armillaria borealis TaxID=47425 RepID=A0AA39MG73_9AGAR|nr:hypothetical protein EV421DRAFT_1910771 [Armillaria borealis]